MCDIESDKIAAYIALLTAEIRREFLIKAQQRNKPEAVPVILLGQLAVDTHYQRQGLAQSLLIFAFKTVLQIAEGVGCYGLMTHPLDESVRTFYQQYGFQDIPSDPARAMMVRVADLRANGF
jgi:GNAT superfamily N-acetyltransferase